MATDSRSKKRKSVDNAETTTKKVKTAPSADKPAPLKSALKKSAVETTTTTKKADGKTAKTTTKTKKDGKKPAKKTAKTELVAEDSSDDDEAPAPARKEPDLAISRELTAAQTAELLAGFSSSEDEDAGSDAEDDGIAISSLPNAPTTGAIQNKIAKATNPDAVPGTIHLSRLPHGFFEQQMRAYFSQFGEITHLRLARNRKTGKSKHFAFIEFASSGVADIVAKTMDKYLMFGHILQAKRVPDEQVGEEFWRGEGRKRVVPRNRLEGARLRRGMGREGWEKRVERENGKREGKRGVLKEMGYEFEMPEVRGVEDVPVQKVLKAGDAEEKPKAIEAAIEAPGEVVRTVQAKPGVVEVTEEKTKKRPAGKEAKVQKAKKAKKSTAVAA